MTHPQSGVAQTVDDSQTTTHVLAHLAPLHCGVISVYSSIAVQIGDRAKVNLPLKPKLFVYVYI